MYKTLSLLALIAVAGPPSAPCQAPSAKAEAALLVEVEEFVLCTTNESAQREDTLDNKEVEVFVVFYRHVNGEKPTTRKPPPDLRRIFEKARQLSESGESQPFAGPGRWYVCSQKGEHFMLFVDNVTMTVRIVPVNAVSETVYLPRRMIEATRDKQLIDWCKRELKK